jgi:hypothetical protein
MYLIIFVKSHMVMANQLYLDLYVFWEEGDVCGAERLGNQLPPIQHGQRGDVEGIQPLLLLAVPHLRQRDEPDH